MQSNLSNYPVYTFKLKADEFGANIATLISHPKNLSGQKAVLYVHGYCDYFFHTHLADFFVEQGFNFHALDIRKYGHSLLPHQIPNFCTSLNEYFDEIDQALLYIDQQNTKEVLLYGHSTGGLIVSYYLKHHRQQNLVKGLILNSPFLSFNVSKSVEKYLFPLILRMANASPQKSINISISTLYGQSLHRNYHGRWNYNLEWKPIESFPIRMAWVKAINEAQLYVQEAPQLDIPTLVLTSHRSASPTDTLDPLLFKSDCVLNIRSIQEKSKAITSDLYTNTIQDAMHDVFLSSPSSIRVGFEKLKNWLHNLES